MLVILLRYSLPKWDYWKLIFINYFMQVTAFI